MLRSEVISIISGRLGQRTGLDAKIISEMVLAQTHFEAAPDLPWFLLTHDETSLDTSTSSRSVSLPSDFIRDYEDIPLAIYLSASQKWKELTKDEFQLLDSKYGSEDSDDVDEPDYYAIEGGYIYFWAKPDAAYDVRLFYYKKATTLDSGDIENAWLANVPMMFVGWCGMQVSRYLRDPEGIKLFKEDYALARADLMNQNIARKESAIARFLGG